jgi:hypothetical protein
MCQVVDTRGRSVVVRWRPRHGGEEDGAESTRVMRINVDGSDVG